MDRNKFKTIIVFTILNMHVVCFVPLIELHNVGSILITTTKSLKLQVKITS